ncbi:hypothetical protein RHMOL_Rhmol01G0021600 [Rhododendron molle]|uniref:Uncharacterized protein n=1 Tax=Rhododendron molle TaxID=49168 RepID=A0ACC0PWY9_RHOML|nr:hypothetical protein RHMOL_Rhmol01G0021600 [Rhododendron molle]
MNNNTRIVMRQFTECRARFGTWRQGQKTDKNRSCGEALRLSQLLVSGGVPLAPVWVMFFTELACQKKRLGRPIFCTNFCAKLRGHYIAWIATQMVYWAL